MNEQSAGGTRHAVAVGEERVCVGDVVQTMSAGAAELHFTCALPDSSDRPSTVVGLSWTLRAEMGEAAAAVHT